MESVEGDEFIPWVEAYSDGFNSPSTKPEDICLTPSAWSDASAANSNTATPTLYDDQEYLGPPSRTYFMPSDRERETLSYFSKYSFSTAAPEGWFQLPKEPEIISQKVRKDDFVDGLIGTSF